MCPCAARVLGGPQGEVPGQEHCWALGRQFSQASPRDKGRWVHPPGRNGSKTKFNQLPPKGRGPAHIPVSTGQGA